MAVESRADIKARMVQGYTLTAQDVNNILDSYWHLEDTLPKDEVVYADTLILAPPGKIDTLYAIRTGNDRGLYTWTVDNGFAPIANVTASGGGGAGTPSTAALTATGITMSVEYWGATAPTLVGANGAYVLTLPTGTRLKSAYLKAPDGALATNADIMSLTISSDDDREEFTSFQITDLGDNKKVVNEKERGISVTEVGNGSDEVTTAFTGINTGTSDFAIIFTQ